MIEAPLEFILTPFLEALLRGLLSVASALLMAPVIVIGAAFAAGSYLENVTAGYWTALAWP
jgi:hypothetical protein